MKFIGILKDKNKTKRIIFDQDERLINDCFAKPTIDFEKEFQHDYTLDKGEWFFCKPPEDEYQHFFEPFKNSGKPNNIEKEEIENIRLLYLLGEDSVTAKRIVPSFFLKNRLLLIWNETMKVKQRENILNIDNKGIDFYFERKSKKLFFKSYNQVKNFFPSIINLYRPAKQEEVSQILNNDLIHSDSTFKPEKVGERNLKAIASFIDSKIDLTNKDVQQEYRDYAKKYSPDITFDDNGKFLVKDNKSLTRIMKVLLENFYTSDVSKEKRQTNSSKKIES